MNRVKEGLFICTLSLYKALNLTFPRNIGVLVQDDSIFKEMSFGSTSQNVRLLEIQRILAG